MIEKHSLPDSVDYRKRLWVEVYLKTLLIDGHSPYSSQPSTAADSAVRSFDQAFKNESENHD